MTVLGYIRVSTEKQDPESQKALLIGYGILPENIFVDEGISGWTDPLVRPVYKRMIKRIDDKTQERVTKIVFSEFSRVGRNIQDSMAEIIRIVKSGIEVESLSDREKPLNTIEEPFKTVMLSMIMAGADLERKAHRERTKWAMDNIKTTGKTKSGKRVGRPSVIVDFDKINETMKKYNITMNMASKVLGYRPSTLYKAKKARGDQK